MSVTFQKIEAKFAVSQKALVLQQSDLSLQSIADMVENKSIDIQPKYQRRERWDDEKESGLIESFLLNIPVPPIYLAEDEYGTYSVIDGKQRVTAIHKFLKDRLVLKSLDKFPELEGFKFSKLPAPLSNALKIRPYLRVVTLLRQSNFELKHEVFLRLNKAGVPLNSQEIRNVAFRSDFNDLLFKLSDDTYLNQQLKAKKGTTIYNEMGDVQYVLRFFTMLEYWKIFPGNMDHAMDEFMTMQLSLTKTQIRAKENLFKNALNFCRAIWGNEAFLKPNGSKRVLQGFYDIQMVCAALLTVKEYDNAILHKAKVRKALVDLLKNDEDFSNSVTQFTSNPANVKYRIETFSNTLKSI